MLKTVSELCNLNAASGNENLVREYILKEIADFCDTTVDKNGNIIAFKKGENKAAKKVMVDAHMDEVGVIITSVTDSGMLRFNTVGGILPESLVGARVCLGKLYGVIGAVPIHLSKDDKNKKPPKTDELFIDIGAKDKENALRHISLGDIGTFEPNFTLLSEDIFRSKAIDDRIGCAALITLLKEDSPCDFYATFTIGEELGLRGATTATYTVSPDYAVVLEATTASDLHDTAQDKMVCKLGGGAVISFMDNSTLYSKKLFDKALEIAKNENIPVQTKNAVAGGNNSGAIHLSGKGVKTISVSIPCRYIHSPCSVASLRDANAQLDLTRKLIETLASGDFDK
jgi:endoglucanase